MAGRKPIFETIPRAPRYEMNQYGTIRNRETGKIIKWQISPNHGKQTTLWGENGKKVCVTLPNLLWLLHGRLTSKIQPVPVVIKKGTRTLRFDSSRQAALFIAKVDSRKYQTCQNRLALRKKTVGEWQIHYCY